MSKTYEEVTIYAVSEDHVGVSLESTQGTVHGAQIWAPAGKNFGPAFKYARRVDRASVDETPEAAIARFANSKRERAAYLRKEAADCLEQARLAEEIEREAVMSNLSEAYAADRAEAESAVFTRGGVDMRCTGCRDWCTRPVEDAGRQHMPCVVWDDNHPSMLRTPGVWKPMRRSCWFYDLKYDRNAGDYVKEYPVTTEEPPGDYRSSHFWRSDKRLSDDEICEWFGYLRMPDGDIARRKDETAYQRPIARIERFPDPPASLCEEYVLEDCSDYGDEPHRWAVIKRANRGDLAECWMTATVIFRSPEFHAIPEGNAYELAAILKAVEQGESESFKRIAIAHEPGDRVVLWSPRNAHEGELSDYLRMPRARLVELLRGWLRPEEILP